MENKIELTDQHVEEATKAYLRSRDLNPNTLNQIHIFTGEEYFDHEDDRGRRYIYSWRQHSPKIRAALEDFVSRLNNTVR